MGDMIFNPYTSVGNIKFNDSRDNVRKNNPVFTEFKKNMFSNNTTDSFQSFHVFYDVNNKVEAVELFAGQEIIYNGQNLMKLTKPEIKELFNDNNINEKDDNINFTTFGIVFNYGDGKVESCLVYRRGYWE